MSTFNVCPKEQCRGFTTHSVWLHNAPSWLVDLVRTPDYHYSCCRGHGSHAATHSLTICMMLSIVGSIGVVIGNGVRVYMYVRRLVHR